MEHIEDLRGITGHSHPRQKCIYYENLVVPMYTLLYHIYVYIYYILCIINRLYFTLFHNNKSHDACECISKFKTRISKKYIEMNMDM